MAKKKVKDAARDLLTDFLQDHALELFHIEFVKEGRDRYLRVYIDKPEDSVEYVSIEDCELVSRYLSERLDEEDLIEENYFLEVSSPGLDRPLLKDSDYVRFAGRQVDVSLYRAGKRKKTDLRRAYRSEGRNRNRKRGKRRDSFAADGADLKDKTGSYHLRRRAVR